MKIIAGHCRGMKLVAPRGVLTRPTGARVREAIMSMLASDLQGAVIFDLFAGSGAIGLEAVSRGARHCAFVEEDKAALAALRQNISECTRRFKAQHLPDLSLQILGRPCADAWRDLQRGPRADIIWADPPYAMAKQWLKGGLLDKLCQVASPGCLFVLEAAAADLAELELGEAGEAQGWQKVKERAYGDSCVVVWQWHDGSQEESADEQGTE